VDTRIYNSIAASPFAVARERERVRPSVSDEQIEDAIAAARDWLLTRQHADGHWVGELEGDTILETEYVLLFQFLGNPDQAKIRKLCNYVVRHWQNEDGGFPIYPGGPSDVSASVKVYFACKLAGHLADEPFMTRLRDRILALGGVTKCNTFTKLYLSIFGQYDWEGVPTIPPEVFVIPDWFFLNIYVMSSWSRAILVPLGIINHTRPHKLVPPGAEIDELFVGGRYGKHLRLPWDAKKVSWRNAFLVADMALKVYDKSKIKPLRQKALAEAERWILERQNGSGGLGAIFPGMTHAVMAFKCLGYPDDHPAIQHELRELEKFEIEEGDEIRVQPCVSPVWDTALSLNALLDSGVPHDHPAIRKAVDWLLDKQVTEKGDWVAKCPSVMPGGWFFEYENQFYPDVDDTIMVLMGLYKAACPNGEHWSTAEPRIREAMQRGLDWVFAMQNKDGGWASFDKDCDKMLFQEVPFADHNAMLDPATPDITARTLEMLSYYDVSRDDPRVVRALDFIRKEQEPDGSWFGRWGVNYLYGTWQVLRGLGRIGENLRSGLFQRGAKWIRSVQNEDGGWGETCESYDAPSLKGMGPSTASQTAWAVMGLLNAGDTRSAEMRHGLEYLVRTQLDEGTWDEKWFTGTGFPKVFYLRYHLYRHYFPLWALSQYITFTTGEKPRTRTLEDLID
jgi:squalene-hopene/tetraprenyl-beta-curcumene cyclase